MSYHLKIAENASEIKLAQVFRERIFKNNCKIADADAFDNKCLHFLIFDKSNANKLVAVFRVMIVKSFNDIERCYSNQFYKLNNLRLITKPMLELGRFCVNPTYKDPAIIFTAWGALKRLVEQYDIHFLFECSSFLGAKTEKYLDSFKLLNKKYLAPKKLIPYVKAPFVFKFSKLMDFNTFCITSAKKSFPPLLTAYLNLGGWVLTML